MRYARPAAFVVAVILSLSFASDARADDFGLGGNIPDNLNHSFCLDFPLEGNEYAAYLIWLGWRGAIGPTDYREVWDPICNSETDVIFQLGHADGFAGVTMCVRPDGSQCRSFVVTIDPALVVDAHDLVSLSCHETGHTLGLDDGPSTQPWFDDCMSTDFTWSETLNQHHVDHVNSRQPYDDPAD